MGNSDLSPESGTDRIVRVFVSSSLTEAQLAQGLLESQGIVVMQKGEGTGPYRAGPVYLWVLQQDEALARSLLDDAQSNAQTADEDDRGG